MVLPDPSAIEPKSQQEGKSHLKLMTARPEKQDIRTKEISCSTSGPLAGAQQADLSVKPLFLDDTIHYTEKKSKQGLLFLLLCTSSRSELIKGHFGISRVFFGGFRGER